MRVGTHTAFRGHILTDRDDRAPFCEFRAEGFVFEKSLAQTIKTFGDLFLAVKCKILRPAVHFNAGHDTFLREECGERCTVAVLLADGFVVKNDAAYVLLKPYRSEKRLAVCATIIFGAFDADGVEALFARYRTFIGGEDALSSGDHLLCCLF